MAAELKHHSPATEGQPEQSMDEILASIRQIIADDSGEPPAKTERQGLTPPADVSNSNATGTTARRGPPPIPKAKLPEPEPMPAPVAPVAPAAPAAATQPAAPQKQPDLEAEIAAGMAKALAVEPTADSLAKDVVNTPEEPALKLAPEDVARTIVEEWVGTHEDELTREVKTVVEPVVRAWLAENLPALVERLIRDEIEAVSRGKVR